MITLTGLDQVDWASLDHAYGSAVDVPDLLAALAAAPDQSLLEEAMGRFLNAVNHQGSIYTSTAHVVPFVWQLVDGEDDALRKSLYLIILDMFIDSAQINVFSTPTVRPAKVSPLRFKVAIELHEAISQEVERFVALLAHPAVDVRALALHVLSFLDEHAGRLLPVVAGFSEKEPDDWVRAAALWAYALLAERGTDWKTQMVHARFLEGRATSSPHRWSKAAAALGYLRLNHKPDPIPGPLVDIIAEGLAHHPGFPPQDRSRYYLSLDLLPFIDIMAEISRCCRARMRPGLWTDVLRSLTPLPLDAHRCVRELLDVTFIRYHRAHGWLNLESLKSHEGDPTLIYEEQGQSRRHYISGQPLLDFEREALQAVVDCDPFWQTPTNLFSFFYHLPDDREALRALSAGG